MLALLPILTFRQPGPPISNFWFQVLVTVARMRLDGFDVMFQNLLAIAPFE